MATFSIDFLGCKVSHVDAHAVRERLLADGHEERGDTADVAVVSTCCVTNEAVAKSRKAVSRLARSHGRVYVTGCAANLSEDAFADGAENVVVVRRPSEETPAAIAGDVGAIACVQADAASRPRARFRQGAGRLQLLVRVLRDPARAWRVAKPSRGRRAGRGGTASRAGAQRGRAHRHQPRLLPRPRGGLRSAHARARGRGDAGPCAAAAVVDRGEPRERGPCRRARGNTDRLAAPPCAAPVRRRRRAPRDGTSLRRGYVSPTCCASSPISTSQRM